MPEIRAFAVNSGASSVESVPLTPAIRGPTIALPSVEHSPMYQERRSARRYAFDADAEVADSRDERIARVEGLSIGGAYLAMANPFPKHTAVLIKIRTNREFFQCQATVAHSTQGSGTGVTFRNISPPFLHVLQRWLQEAMHERSDSVPKMTEK